MATPTSFQSTQTSAIKPSSEPDEASIEAKNSLLTEAKITLLNRVFSASAAGHQLDGYLLKLLHHSNTLYHKTFFPEGSTTKDLPQRVDTLIKTFKDAQQNLDLKKGSEYQLEIDKICVSNEPLSTILLLNTIAKQIRGVLGSRDELHYNRLKAYELNLLFESFPDKHIGKIASNVLAYEQIRKEDMLCNKRHIDLLKHTFTIGIETLQLGHIFLKLMQECTANFLTTFFKARLTTESLDLRVTRFLKKIISTRQALNSLNEQDCYAQCKEIQASNPPLALGLTFMGVSSNILAALEDQTQSTVKAASIIALDKKFKSNPNPRLKKVARKVLEEAFNAKVDQIRQHNKGGSSQACQGGGAKATTTGPDLSNSKRRRVEK